MKSLRTLPLIACLLLLPACQTMQSFETFMDDITKFSLDLPGADENEGESAEIIADAPYSHETYQQAQPVEAVDTIQEITPEDALYANSHYEQGAPKIQRATPVKPSLMGNFCPEVEIVEELSALNEFTDMAAPSPQNLISSVKMLQVEGKCTHNSKDVTVDLKLAFESILGPKAKVKNNDRPFFSYPFFIAVTGPKGNILAKEVFSASMTYAPGERSHTYYESLRQIIPASSKHQSSLHKVLIGFQLNQPQLNYNRANLKSSQYQRQGRLDAIPLRDSKKYANAAPQTIAPKAPPKAAPVYAPTHPPKHPGAKPMRMAKAALAPKTATIPVSKEPVDNAAPKPLMTEETESGIGQAIEQANNQAVTNMQALASQAQDTSAHVEDHVPQPPADFLNAPETEPASGHETISTIDITAP